MAERSSDPSGASFLRAGAEVTERWGGAWEPSPSRWQTQDYIHASTASAALLAREKRHRVRVGPYPT